jgi:hypothetical protein
MSSYVIEREVEKEIIVEDISPELQGRYVLKYYKDGSIMARSLFAVKDEYKTKWE